MAIRFLQFAPQRRVLNPHFVCRAECACEVGRKPHDLAARHAAIGIRAGIPFHEIEERHHLGIEPDDFVAEPQATAVRTLQLAVTDGVGSGVTHEECFGRGIAVWRFQFKHAAGIANASS